MKKYKLSVCGGTFDLLHDGHKKFLTQVFNNSENVIIGLTSNKFTSEKNIEIQDFEIRKRNLINYLNIYFKDCYKILEIDNVFGPLLEKDFNADVLFVTNDTQKGAKIVNSKRKEVGLSKIKVEIVEIKKSDNGMQISSTAIRNGLINRSGKNYVSDEWIESIFTLPKNIRPELQKPFGKLLTTVPDNIEGSKTITIGDITTYEFNKKNINQKLSIIDFQVQRKNKFNNISDLGFNKDIEIIKVKNEAGSINGNLFEVIKNAIKNENRQVILVEGEEDLVVLPVILIFPLGFRIYYGQPNEGLVEVLITEEIKKNAFELFNKFSS